MGREMTAISNYLNHIIKNPIAIGLILLVAAVFIVVIALRLTRRKVVKAEMTAIEPIEKASPITKAALISKAATILMGKGVKGNLAIPEVSEPPTKVILGSGKYKCMAIRSAKVLNLLPGTNVIDFTTMPEQIGEIHLADTSCPISGAIYTVKENDDGTISDYDPREVVIDVEQSPEHSYFATHWPIVHEVFGIPISPLSNPSFWFAMVALAGAIFLGLVALGG